MFLLLFVMFMMRLIGVCAPKSRCFQNRYEEPARGIVQLLLLLLLLLIKCACLGQKREFNKRYQKRNLLGTTHNEKAKRQLIQ